MMHSTYTYTGTKQMVTDCIPPPPPPPPPPAANKMDYVTVNFTGHKWMSQVLYTTGQRTDVHYMMSVYIMYITNEI